MNDTQLLVSVRSADEAMLALAGGAALIDVKEPARGSLGRANLDVISAVAAAVGRLRPVSAALGEWVADERAIPEVALTYVKWGLAGCSRHANWSSEMRRLLAEQRKPDPVLVAYADWECAQAPPVEQVFALAADHPGSTFLLDTHCKDANGKNRRSTLLDWLPLAWLEDLCRRARAAHVKIALAGSLGSEEIRMLLPARPDWFAVRGAVCDAGDRHTGVQLDKVRQIVDLIASAN